MPEDVKISIASPKKMPAPPMHLILSKEQIKEVKVGESAKFIVTGEIEGIHKLFESELYGVDLKGGAIQGIEVNKADRDLSNLKNQVEIMNEADRGYRDSLEG